jgi:hypothetical protein
MATAKEFYWHLHHRQLVEPLSEPLQNRIDYINVAKPKDERATRLHLIRRANLDGETLDAFSLADKYGLPAFLQDALNQRLEALHAEQCFPDCPWDGQTILPNSGW